MSRSLLHSPFYTLNVDQRKNITRHCFGKEENRAKEGGYMSNGMNNSSSAIESVTEDQSKENTLYTANW
jgi:hypothetical protein